MALKSEDVLGFLGGATGIIVLGLFAYWLMWDTDAEKMVDKVKQLIKTQEKQWSQAGGEVKISYNDVISSGFPFYTKVRVLMPKIQLSLPEGTVQFSMNYLNFQFADESSGEMEVSYLPDAVMSVKPAPNVPQKNFYLHLSDTPIVSIRPSVNSENEKITRQMHYYLSYPDRLTLDVELDGKSVKLPWRLNISEPFKEQPVPSSIHPVLRWLVLVLQQSMARP